MVIQIVKPLTHHLGLAQQQTRQWLLLHHAKGSVVRISIRKVDYISLQLSSEQTLSNRRAIKVS